MGNSSENPHLTNFGTVAVLRHPAGQKVVGVSFAPHVRGLLATACGDGRVRLWSVIEQMSNGGNSSNGTNGNVFNPANNITMSFDASKPIAVLEGHSARVFNVVWHPVLPGVLASGSDDKTIRVWGVRAR